MDKKELDAKYPNLYLASDCGAVWVKRDNRDAEAISYNFVEADLAAFNEEAGKAIQPRWFYCSRCKTAKMRVEFAYFYFAGSYCVDCMNSNLPHYHEAMRETYN